MNCAPFLHRFTLSGEVIGYTSTRAPRSFDCTLCFISWLVPRLVFHVFTFSIHRL